MIERLLKNNRGQIIIALAIVISVIVLSIALSTNKMSLQSKQLRYEPVKETALALTSDLNRALTLALREASRKYNLTRNYREAASKGQDVIFNWASSLIAAYSHLGVKAKLSTSNEDSSRASINIHFDWSGETGISYAYTDLDLDIDAYGFRGWSIRSQKSVTLKIFPETVRNDTTLIFNLMEDNKPVPNLTLNLIQVYAYASNYSLVPLEVKSLKYLGEGNYTVEFTPPSKNIMGITILAATPTENIIVSARHLTNNTTQPESGNEDWTTLYMGRTLNSTEVMLLPLRLWDPKASSLGHGKEAPVISYGQPETHITSPKIPCNITLEGEIYVNLYIAPNPDAKKTRNVSVTLSIIYEDGASQLIGSSTCSVSSEGFYNFNIAVPNSISRIPKGSQLLMTITATFKKNDSGSLFIICEKDGNQMSKIILNP
jgi:hypothetical protein